MKKQIELVQTLLKQNNLYQGEIDGMTNTQTLQAIAGLVGIDVGWPEKRKIVGAIQVFADKEGISTKPIDGFWGPITEEAFNELSAKVYQKEVKRHIWRPEEIIEANPNNWPKQYTDEFNAFYGNQGENLVRVNLPYEHRFSWALHQKTRSFQCHVKVADSISRILTKVLEHYGETEIKRLKLDVWGGCFNIRPIRGGTRPSMHSWGIAVDYDPDHNKLDWGADKATFARSDYHKWWELWEEEGWLSLGRARNFDWMHVQAAKI
jgi:hypothetical protein